MGDKESGLVGCEKRRGTHREERIECVDIGRLFKEAK